MFFFVSLVADKNLFHNIQRDAHSKTAKLQAERLPAPPLSSSRSWCFDARMCCGQIYFFSLAKAHLRFWREWRRNNAAAAINSAPEGQKRRVHFFYWFGAQRASERSVSRWPFANVIYAARHKHSAEINQVCDHRQQLLSGGGLPLKWKNVPSAENSDTPSADNMRR